MSGYRGGKVQPDDDENQPAMTCRKCFTPTPRATLADFEAQCFPCYQACLREPPRYYRAGMPETPTVADMKTRIRRSA